VENKLVHMRKVPLGPDFGQQIGGISDAGEKELIVTSPPDFVREGAQVTIAAPPVEIACGGAAGHSEYAAKK
jgi:hypothetical protein